jgi:hypothetical protein
MGVYVHRADLFTEPLCAYESVCVCVCVCKVNVHRIAYTCVFILCRYVHKTLCVCVGGVSTGRSLYTGPVGVCSLQVDTWALSCVHLAWLESKLWALCRGGRPAGRTLLRKSIHKDLAGWALPSCLPSQAQASATWPLKLELVAGPSLCWLPKEGEHSECDSGAPALLAPRQTTALSSHFPESLSFPAPHIYFWVTPGPARSLGQATAEGARDPALAHCAALQTC